MKAIPEPIIPTRVYKPVEAAQLLQVDKEAIYKAIENNELPKKDVGKGFRILGEHLLTFMGSVVYKPQTPTEQNINNMGAASVYQDKK